MIGIAFFLAAAVSAPALQSAEQVPPSPAMQAAIDAGDVGAAAEQAAIETEACLADAGAEPTIETLAPCASLIMLAAQLSQQAGMYDEALDFGEAGTNLGVAAFGENSDIVAYSRRARGLALLELGRPDEGYAELAAALSAGRELYGDNDPELTLFLGAMANAELAKSKAAKAVALLREALALEDDELFLAQWQVQYTVALILLDDAEAAVKQARAAVDTFARLVGDNSTQAVDARIRLAGALAAAQRTDEALELLDPLIASLDGMDGFEFLLVEALFEKGKTLIRMSALDDAAVVLEKSLHLSRKINGDDASRTAVIVDQLAALHQAAAATDDVVIHPPAEFYEAYNAGDMEQAEAILAPIAKKCGREYSPDGPDPDKLAPCVTQFTMLSMTYSGLNQLRLAAQFSDLSIAIAEANMGDPSRELGQALMARGLILQQKSRIMESVPYLERSVAMLEGDSPNQAASMLFLASARLDTGDAELSLELVQKAIALAGTEFAPINFINVKALALLALGRIDEAESLLREAMAANPDITVPTRLKLETALAQTFLEQLKFDESIAMLDRLVSEVRAIFGEHPLTANVIDLLGTAHLRKGDNRAAIDALRESLAIKRALVGDDTPQAALAYNSLGLALLDSGAIDEAKNLILRALEIVRKLDEFNFDAYSAIAISFARLAELVNDPATSLEVADALVRYAEAYDRLDTPIMATIRVSRGTALTRLGRLDEADRELDAAWDTASASDNRRQSAFAAAIAKAQVAIARKDRSTARKWFGRAEDIARRTFEPTSSYRSTVWFLHGAFELDTGGDLAAARTLLRRSADGSLSRIESYDDFDAAAQCEMRGLSQIFRNQVEAAWKLQSAP
ncbi:tetratricopeptide repeat protein [Pseudoblastomonas halimionae]|uniref:Tetratricopeptide repeat protein n=1 Tax=Alteriqipengyuania halimionae TaxID=1926630 RepID=A0A6I4U4Q5_9SPHN|nr:tetratricopeptide repeat protein [Alteriqipengyuania halimionae]MXP09893.1 tetratricopeptide repeat protein [Alteriqipengyuania halimionae]